LRQPPHVRCHLSQRQLLFLICRKPEFSNAK
jgi:hypothetical protein